jgi:hypothetical protein
LVVIVGPPSLDGTSTDGTNYGRAASCSLTESSHCLHFAYYNFCRIHQTLRVTPAMESNLTDHVWTIAELLA